MFGIDFFSYLLGLMVASIIIDVKLDNYVYMILDSINWDGDWCFGDLESKN